MKDIRGKDIKRDIKRREMKGRDIKVNEVPGKGRVLHFVNAGERDVSEVVISSGVHKAGPTDASFEISYKISYGMESDQNPLSLKEEFAKAADAILLDAKNNKIDRPGNNQ